MEHFYVGIDLGATSVKSALFWNEYFDITNIRKKPFINRKRVVEEVNNNLIFQIDNICKTQKELGNKLGGIGIAIGALFDRDTGQIIDWPNNQKWNGFRLLEYLKGRYNVPIVLEDDANAATLGEKILGEGKDYTDFAYVTVSTGIGCGIIINNSLVTGYRGWAGELGHIRSYPNNEMCTCGAIGCLQAIASGPAIKNIYCKTSKIKNIDLSRIVQAAVEGDVKAKFVFEQAGKQIGDTLANLVMIIDIPLIVLGGGVIETGDIIIKPIIKQIEERLYGKRKVKVVKTKLYDKNGVIGVISLLNSCVNSWKTIDYRKDLGQR